MGPGLQGLWTALPSFKSFPFPGLGEPPPSLAQLPLGPRSPNKAAVHPGVTPLLPGSRHIRLHSTRAVKAAAPPWDGPAPAQDTARRRTQAPEHHTDEGLRSPAVPAPPPPQLMYFPPTVSTGLTRPRQPCRSSPDLVLQLINFSKASFSPTPTMAQSCGKDSRLRKVSFWHEGERREHPGLPLFYVLMFADLLPWLTKEIFAYYEMFKRLQKYLL